MRSMKIVVMAMAGFILLALGCQSTPKRTVLSAPAGTRVVASHHNDEGIEAYQQQQWESAKQHFDAAIDVSPEFAEAHYNLGLILYRPHAMQEGNAHFLKAANLALGK